MIYNFKNIFSILFLLIPFFLITGPAIPDLVITFGTVFGLLWMVTKKQTNVLILESITQISLFFWFGLILISFFAINKANSFQDSLIFLRFLLIPIFLYFLYFKNEKIFYYFLLSVFILVIFVSIDTLFQFFNYSTADGFGEDLLGFKSKWYGRMTGPFGDELVPGAYVSKFGIIGYVYLVLNKRLNNIFLIHPAYLSLVLLTCFISGERMALASFMLALFLLLLFDKNKIKIFISLVIGFSLIGLVYVLHPYHNDYKVIESNEFHQGLKIQKEYLCENNQKKICTNEINIQPKFLKIIKNFSTSAYGEIYLLGFNMFKNNPITGIGISNFEHVCENDNNYKKMMINYNCASHPHNTYMQWLVEGGLIIFCIFMAYLFIIFNFIIKNIGNRKFKIYSIILIIVLFWPIMSTGSLIKNWYGISVFFIIGVSLCISKIKQID